MTFYKAEFNILTATNVAFISFVVEAESESDAILVANAQLAEDRDGYDISGEFKDVELTISPL